MISAGEPTGSVTISGSTFARRDALINSDGMSGMDTLHPNDTEKRGRNFRLELAVEKWTASFDRTFFQQYSDSDDPEYTYLNLQYKFSAGRNLLDMPLSASWIRFGLNANVAAGFSKEDYTYHVPSPNYHLAIYRRETTVPLVGAGLVAGIFFGEEGFRVGVQMPVGVETRPFNGGHTTVSSAPSVAARVEW